MKTIIHISVTLVTLFFLASSGYSQTLGFTYQAVIINPEVQITPGNDIYGGVHAESEVSLRFSIDSYQEEHFLTTDKYGMIALMVGQGDVLSGDFNSIVWDGSDKSLLVEIDFSATGDEYEDLDTHMLTYTPHPMTNEELEWIEGIELNVEINALAIIAEEARALAAEALIQADVDQNELDSDSADAAIQADVDQNEVDSDLADAAIQADVDANETASDSADDALQAGVDTNASANSATQADVDANEADSDATIAALEAEVNLLQTEVNLLQSQSTIVGCFDPTLEGFVGTYAGQIYIRYCNGFMYFWDGFGWVLLVD